MASNGGELPVSWPANSERVSPGSINAKTEIVLLGGVPGVGAGVVVEVAAGQDAVAAEGLRRRALGPVGRRGVFGAPDRCRYAPAVRLSPGAKRMAGSRSRQAGTT
jgi:hypothetical protein